MHMRHADTPRLAGMINDLETTVDLLLSLPGPPDWLLTLGSCLPVDWLSTLH